MLRRDAFLSPSGLAEWEVRPEVSYLRAHGYGDLVPRPDYGTFDLGRAVDARLKVELARPLPRPWPGSRFRPERVRPPTELPQELAGTRDAMVAAYLASGASRGVRWDPTGDRVATRVLDLAGRRVPIGGIPDAVRGRTPIDLKTTRAADGALRTVTWAVGPEVVDDGRRLARGADGPADWVIRRHPDWCTAAVFYAWILGGWSDAVTAEWHQIDGSVPGATPTVRVLRVRLGPRFVRAVARRVRACWEALEAGADALPPMYRDLRPADLAVLVAT